MEHQGLNYLLNTFGFVVVKNAIDPALIAKIDGRHRDLYPTRAHDVNNKYWPGNVIDQCADFAYWWSQQLHDWFEVDAVSHILVDRTKELFDTPCVYVADIISNTPKNRYIKPHIDTPYRFDQWHDSFDLLGIQCIIPLCKFSKENGGTGLLPGSHIKNWVVKDSYRGLYNDLFMAGVYQPEMNPGDVLFYHPRVLHSTMPNYTDQTRRALLIHITSVEMANQLKLVDNIWNE
jgi:ectoine hydroxylase-related dioxygenase (phytanoyl-CoA dioxygenase family)